MNRIAELLWNILFRIFPISIGACIIAAAVCVAALLAYMPTMCLAAGAVCVALVLYSAGSVAFMALLAWKYPEIHK